MFESKNFFIDSCDDMELNIKRESKLEFKLTYDNEKEIKTIICLINGLGDDINDDLYLSEYCARNFDVAVLSVNYHCIGNRLKTGAEFYVDEIDKLILKTSLEAIRLNIPVDIENINTYDDFYNVVDIINKLIEKLKKEQYFDEQYRMYLSLGFKPARNEYQNFGIMQAMDIINALLYVKANIALSTTGGGIKSILIGASHGGYLANLC
ncbi:DUF2920 family protein, partial [Campylobacter sp.]|uniref:DUF2920 family protein n=1 Tax=Campylobacter sp. TaxID=205 RepID=UPI0025BE2BA2